MPTLDRHGLIADLGRFATAGVVNTVLTLLAYQLALLVLPASLAYLLAWVLGIVFLMAVYPDRVFPGGRRGTRDRLLLAAGYVAVFLVGLLVLEVATRLLGSPRLAIFASLAFTSATSFLVSRMLLRR